MFIGHLATGFAAKAVERRPSLGTYLIAATFADLLFSGLVLVGAETVRIVPGHTPMVPLAFDNYPYSHSLMGTLMSAVLMAGIYWLWRRSTRAALLIAALVVGHWVLDVISHVPDMPLGLSGPYLGLSLWRSIPATFLVEGSLFVAGVGLYLRATVARDRIGRWALAGMITLLVLAYVSSPFSPPPPSGQAIAVTNLAASLLVLWAIWVDRHRAPRRTYT